MLLSLIRHGSAADSSTDETRALTKGGMQEAERLGLLMPMVAPPIEMIIHSPLLRALQTADIIRAASLSKAVLKEEKGITPNSDTDGFALILEGLKYKHVAVVSHLPFLPKLVCQLLNISPVQLQLGYPPASCTILESSSTIGWMLKSHLAFD